MSATSTMIAEIPQRRIMSLQATTLARGSSLRTDARFGKYVLGQTLGEGEFGKVKLGWAAKRNDSKSDAQVAIKLIRKESLGNSRSRMNKIEREILVLQRVDHSNIVKCHEVIETDKYIGIILEYASGGELFDYILAHRYLKDPTACRLFAQLISAVQYLHLSGIVHRDLKLENLLLDRNRNIIITDFGFANTFNAAWSQDDTTPMGVRTSINRGQMSGDLMQTSCGSPCYAAPELVVGDGKYCGRKVDVWSCGVILYAMLAGYLPFDDDPANPEGDNISLLYRYIVNTPLTFPEYVTPLARDLLRRILVPDPEKRTCLNGIITHSWLKPHARVVLTYERKPRIDHCSKEILSVTSQDMIRSSSERTASHASHTLPQDNHLALTGFCKKTSLALTDHTTSKNKRHTVQIEYDLPVTQNMPPASSKTSNSVSEAKTFPTNSLSVAAAPSMARSASHSGANSQAAHGPLQPLPPAKQVCTKGNAKLPGPMGRPRPTSYHPSSCIIPEVSDGTTFNKEPVLEINSKKSDHTKRWSKPSFNHAKTASPRSTKQNVSGELTTSGLVVKRATLGDIPQADLSTTDSSTSATRSHKRNSSSISSLLGKFWLTSISKSSSTIDVGNPVQSNIIMDPIQETLLDEDLLMPKTTPKVHLESTDIIKLGGLSGGDTSDLLLEDSDGLHLKSDLVTSPIILPPHNEGQHSSILTRSKSVKTHERVSSSAARRVMDFFTNRRKDRATSNTG